MPSSGARSGTKPSRAGRGAGTGRMGPTKLECGHETWEQGVARFASGSRLYRCPEGCGLVEAQRRPS